MRKKPVYYTWPSALLLLALVFYLYLNGNRDVASYYQISTLIFNDYWQFGAMGAVLFILWLDIRHFYRRQKKLIGDNSDLREQVKALTDSKKQLQNKAHTYSGQAEKLKLFISDRLLEHIEYDEKFLHFRGIAAEVRHNGIISYDKVLTALHTASTTLIDGSSIDGAFIDSNGLDGGNGSGDTIYTEALTSLNYLWDLLDLSTADNIALHINNHLCECEEYFYQAQLQVKTSEPQLEDQPGDPLPYSPTFFAHNALLRAIQPLMTDPDAASIITADEYFTYCETDNQFHFTLEKHCELLGNENHLVLMMENLVKNALFYSNKIKSGNPQSKKYNRIALSLTNSRDFAKLSIYNHGPHISDEIKDQIFKLGYTTRRAKDEHGRGLGLYFVKEIVNGYEGKIAYTNICNEQDSYSIRIELESGSFEGAEIITNIIDTVIKDDQVHCINHSLPEADAATDFGPEEPVKNIEWKYSKAIKSIEITPGSTGKTYTFTDFSSDNSVKILDPNHSKIPRWALEIQPKKRSSKVTFVPLDITGVEFRVSLPCAGSQFDYEEEEIHKASDAYINGMEGKFKPI